MNDIVLTLAVVPRKSLLRTVSLILVALVFAMRVLAAPTNIQSAIELAELYSGVCLSIDPACSLDAEKNIDLGDKPVSHIYLGYHLLGSVKTVQYELFDVSAPAGSLAVHPISLPLWIFCVSIYRPPRFALRLS